VLKTERRSFRDARGNIKVESKRFRPSTSEISSLSSIRSKYISLSPRENVIALHQKSNYLQKELIKLRRQYPPNVLSRMSPLDRQKVQTFILRKQRELGSIEKNRLEELAKRDGVSEYTKERDKKLDTILQALDQLKVPQNMTNPIENKPSALGCHVNISVK